MANLIDAHSHTIYTNCPKQTMLCATNETSWSNSTNNHYRAIGIHPWFLDSLQLGWENRLELQLKHDKSVAIGECGLDFYRPIKKILQQAVFETHIALAQKYKRALIIHAVKCWPTLLAMIPKRNTTGLIHRFNGSLEIAEQLIDRGYYLSFGPEINQNISRRVADVIKNIPQDKILIESDAIDESFTLIELQRIYHSIAKMRNCSLTSITQSASESFQKLFTY